MNLQDPRIIAIRSDKAVGAGSCSSIDECYDAYDLIQFLDEDGIVEPAAAVAWARSLERLKLETALNCRSGSDDDPQLEWMREFEARCAAHT